MGYNAVVENNALRYHRNGLLPPFAITFYSLLGDLAVVAAPRYEALRVRDDVREKVKSASATFMGRRIDAHRQVCQVH